MLSIPKSKGGTANKAKEDAFLAKTNTSFAFNKKKASAK